MSKNWSQIEHCLSTSTILSNKPLFGRLLKTRHNLRPSAFVNLEAEILYNDINFYKKEEWRINK